MPPEAVKATLYGALRLAEGKELVVIESCGATVNARPFEVSCPILSLACAVNAKLPAEVGTPVTAPLVLMVKPGGSVPLETVYVYGVTPPEAAIAPA